MEIQLHLEIVHYMYFENGLIYTRYYTLQRLTFIARNLIPSNEKTQMTHDKKQDIAKIITHTNKLKKLQNVTFPWVFFFVIVPLLPPNTILHCSPIFSFWIPPKDRGLFPCPIRGPKWSPFKLTRICHKLGDWSKYINFPHSRGFVGQILPSCRQLLLLVTI